MWRQAIQSSEAARPRHDTIAERAYLKSLLHPGLDCPVRDWLEAERELQAERIAQRISG
jgi:hypothetical protein